MNARERIGRGVSAKTGAHRSRRLLMPRSSELVLTVKRWLLGRSCCKPRKSASPLIVSIVVSCDRSSWPRVRAHRLRKQLRPNGLRSSISMFCCREWISPSRLSPPQIVF